MQIATSADALARTTYNALLYAPKEPPWDMSLVSLSPKTMTFLTSDSYSLACATCLLESAPDVVPGVSFKIMRSDLEAIEEQSRKGKRGRVTLDFDMDRHEIWYRGEDSETDFMMEDVFEDGIGDDSWDETNLSVFRRLIAERALDPQARQILLSPLYLRKLGQLKRDKNQGADVWIAGEDDPVLIKVGDGFGLIIQPINRERHRAALGEGAIWGPSSIPSELTDWSSEPHGMNSM